MPVKAKGKGTDENDKATSEPQGETRSVEEQETANVLADKEQTKTADAPEPESSLDDVKGIETVDKGRAARQKDPGKWAGLVPDRNGTPSYVEVEGFRERRILYKGMNYEHIAEDADGVWLYANM